VRRAPETAECRNTERRHMKGGVEGGDEMPGTRGLLGTDKERL